MNKPLRESRTTELGLELRCGHCGDFWPADEQFFYRDSRGDGWQNWCKACQDTAVYEKRRERGVTRSNSASLPSTTWLPLLAWSNTHAAHVDRGST